TAGHLFVGDVDLATCDPEGWRRHVAWLPQRPTIFRGTVADNIRLGDPDADGDTVRWAAQLAGAAGVVERLRDGYGTLVGAGARPLSAGEAQRLALARTLIRDTPLLILDEPTANLDPTSAERVGAAIDSVRADRTVLLITHSANAARQAD